MGGGGGGGVKKTELAKKPKQPKQFTFRTLEFWFSRDNQVSAGIIKPVIFINDKRHTHQMVKKCRDGVTRDLKKPIY